jgi:hypothetical protein
MIHNLEVERRRIEEALEVLRRLHKIRKPSSINAQTPDAEDTSPANGAGTPLATGEEHK